jgi:hypothetical protein
LAGWPTAPLGSFGVFWGGAGLAGVAVPLVAVRAAPWGTAPAACVDNPLEENAGVVVFVLGTWTGALTGGCAVAGAAVTAGRAGLRTSEPTAPAKASRTTTQTATESTR